MRMPFGKHAGVELTDVPRQYLRWLRTQQWVGAWLVKEINDVLDGKVVAADTSFEETLKQWNDDNLAHHGDEPAKVDK